MPATPRPKPTTSSHVRQRLLEREDSQTKVLIVDQSRIDAERSRMELQRAGVATDIRVVSTLDEVRASVVSFAPDVVISELTFSDFDGYDAQRVVEELRPSTPLIFVSNVDADVVSADVAASGAVDCIPKNNLFRLPNTVVSAVREAAEQRRFQKSFAISNVRSREQHERLEAIWRLVNDPHLSEDAFVGAVLNEAIRSIGNAISYFAMLGHIDGSEFVIDDVAGELGPEDGPARRLLRAGMRGPATDVIHLRDVAAGRTHSWDDIDAFPNPPAYSREAGLRSQITTQFLAGGVGYMLTLGSLESVSASPYGVEDYAYVEVVGSILARHLEQRRHAASLRAAQAHNRWHDDRRQAVMRIVDDPTLRGTALFTAMLRKAAAAMRPGQTFEGTLGHIEGSEFVIDAASIEHVHAGDAKGLGLLGAGSRIALEETLNVRNLAGGRTQSWEDCQDVPDLPQRLRMAGLRSQIMTQFVANGIPYILTLRSLDPPSETPFSSEDYDYIEVIASIFARTLEIEAMESSLREAESLGRRHVKRLDSFWRIVNTSDLRGPQLVRAMLREAALTMRDGQAYVAILQRSVGAEFVVDAVVAGSQPAGAVIEAPAIGTLSPRSASLSYTLLTGRTQAWEDLQAVPGVPDSVRAAGWRSMIATTFEAVGSRYELTIGSTQAHVSPPFGPEDAEYIEVVAAVLARQKEFERAEDSLDDAESRARQHAGRLEALWRISNNPSLQGADVIVAMLQHGAAAIRPSQHFIGLLGRIEGDEVTFVAEDSSPDDASAQGMFRVGVRVPLDKTLIPRVDRTRAWEDLAALGDDVPVVELARGWRSLIVTIFDAGGARYALGFASDEPMQSPFGPEDISYLEVLASSFAGRLQVDELESSLRDAEERSRQHAERLEALWQIINSSNHNDDELVLAMLQQATTTIQPGQAFEASLLRVDGDSVIVEAVTGSPDTAPGELHLHVGGTIPLESTSLSRVLAEGGGTRSWDDIETSPYSSAASRQRGTRAVVITTFIAGDTTWALVFTSTRTTSRRPLGPQDHAYVEVLASFFANHLQQKWQFDRMAHQQSHDTLTGLLNRSTFRSQARAAALASERYAMILVDVDDLHEINESYGHTAGDALLAEIAHSLRGRAHADDIVGRIGGDVFGIFIREQGPAEQLLARVLDFGDVFARPFAAGAGTELESGGRATFINRTACIGVASAPEDGTEFEAILSRADAALFTAKERGHGSTVFYVAGMEAEAQRRTTLHNELREAIANDQFNLYYQPHVEMATGLVSGCEALIRWNHPERGVVLPGDFIPFAEQTGMITAIDAWVMRTSFEAARKLGALRPGFRLYFNLSGRQASDPALIRSFIDAARSGLPLANIGVEITETDAMRDVVSTRLVCRALRRLDVRIAIDDFGTGYSSLSSLKRLPVDVVKIDRSFVSGVLHDPHDATITETIVAIADQFGFATLAEGVEDEAERDWLRQRGCRYMQGYAVCQPLPLDAFLAWLGTNARELPTS